MTKKIVIINAPSGSGKDTVLKILAEKHGFKPVVSYTSRKPRDGEVDGVNYHFISEEKFVELYLAGFFAEVTYYPRGDGDFIADTGVKYYYGCAGKDLVDGSVLVCNPFGVEQIQGRVRQLDLDLSIVFVHTNEGVRMLRLFDRGDSSDEVSRRLRTDKVEFKGMDDKSDLIIVNNGDLQTLEWRIRTQLIPAIEYNI